MGEWSVGAWLVGEWLVKVWLVGKLCEIVKPRRAMFE